MEGTNSLWGKTISFHTGCRGVVTFTAVNFTFDSPYCLCLLQSNMNLTGQTIMWSCYKPGKSSLGMNIPQIACVAGAWKYWAQERTGGREGDTWGKKEYLPGRPTKIVSTHILWVWIFPVGREAPEGKSNCSGWENCPSIVHGQHSEGLILHHQLLKPLNGIIEVEVLEVTLI